MAAAWSLSRFPDKFDVTVIEPSRVCGGVACTFEHEYAPGETVPVNYGVQGGSPNSHQNTKMMMNHFGYDISFTSLLVSFGQGGNNWKNYDRSDLQEQLKAETKKFGKVLKWIYRLEFITTFMSINRVLKMFSFSDDFRNRMVYPLVALFFGTGNKTPEVSAAVIARVFLDESLSIFNYDEDYLLNQTPTNVSFPNLEDFYETMKEKIAHDHCRFVMGTEVTRVVRDKRGIELTTRPAAAMWRGGSTQEGGRYPIGGGGARCTKGHAEDEARLHAAAMRANPDRNEPVSVQVFESSTNEPLDEGKENGPSDIPAPSTYSVDELIFACPANVAKALLGEGAGFWEKRVLGAVEYYLDLTVTHTDEEYMKRHNDVDGKAFYFIKTYEKRPEFLEMGFELTGYQPELAPLKERGDKIYQTIYLNAEEQDDWTIKDLDEKKVLDRAWWSAFSHTYKHFRRVVPWVWTVQGTRHTWYCGSWTLFNTHDIAICSGFAVAERLGAPYPFPGNKLAAATYDTVLNTSHLKRRRKNSCFGWCFAAH
eukprot:TRINITY_DN14985_c0_g1_i1.p1 TRINITY_DN14985_c0_g1~~TRINITY_DN14985_c0_g1_i1.p1  ORF type:complete len:580 (+),score=217.78 TRINITY_DN14985_c0_g1_i1:131-1741(+)